MLAIRGDACWRHSQLNVTFIHPELKIHIVYCSGILIQTLADASNDRHTLSAPQILLNVGGFLLTVVTTIVFTVYAKRQLKVLQKEEQSLLQ